MVVQDQKFKPQNFLASGCLEINDGSSFIMMKKGCDEDGTFRVEVLYIKWFIMMKKKEKEMCDDEGGA